MSIPESRKRLGQILAETTGVKDIEEVLHTEGVPAVRKRLAEQGLVNKALPPTPPTKKPPMPPQQEAQALEADAAANEDMAMEDDAMAEDMEEEAGAKTENTLDDVKRMMIVMDSMYSMFQTILDNAAASEMDRVGMYKELTELKELRMSEKAADKVTIESLEEKMKALQERVSSVETQVRLTPRSVTHQKGGTADELKVAIDKAETSRLKGELIHDPFFGDILPLEAVKNGAPVRKD